VLNKNVAVHIIGHNNNTIKQITGNHNLRNFTSLAVKTLTTKVKEMIPY